jgi:hypothetical protein
MYTYMVVPVYPVVKALLQLLYVTIDLLAECYPLEFIQHRLVPWLTDTIGLWALGLYLSMRDPLSSNDGNTWSSSRSAALIGCLLVYSLAKPSAELEQVGWEDLGSYAKIALELCAY